MLSKEQADYVVVCLMSLMQASILVPMVVVWRRKRHFTPAVKLLSWYVYLSAVAALGPRLLYPAVFATNYGFICGFNIGKILLFGAVYYKVLQQARIRQLVLVVAILSAVVLVGLYPYNTLLTITLSRVVQCTILAGCALLYMEQLLSQRTAGHNMHDPLWLLSVGQLLYSAGTVTAFSLEYLSVTIYDQTWKYCFVALSGLAFNYFLTLAFLRAQPDGLSAPDMEASPSTLVGS